MDAATKRIFGLDLMRATAILMVLCSHLLSIYPRSTNKISQILALFGYWGVEIFFVLSGYLIGNILYRLFVQEEFTVHTVFYFLKRRWLRTLPNYYLVLVLNIAMACLFGFYIQDAGYYFLFLQNFAAPMKPFFPESWSLSVEEYAYLITPFALLLAVLVAKVKNRPKGFIGVVLFLIMIFLATKILYNFSTANTTIEEWNVSLKPVVIYRIDSILIGILASWIHINFKGFWNRQKNRLFVSGLFLLMLMFVGVGFFRILIEEYPFFWNVLYLPFTSIIFTFFLPVLSQCQSAPDWVSRPVTFISVVSYSVYLIHYSLVLQLMKWGFNTDSYSVSQLHIFTFCYLVLTFFLSFLLYRFFEKPIMDSREK